MNLYIYITTLNGILYKRDTFTNKIMGPLRYLLRKLALLLLPTFFLRNPVNQKAIDVNNHLVVSLTSFPSRIGHLNLVIESLLRQKLVPSKIVLWLSKEQFPNELSDLPKCLISLMGPIFDIRFVENDYRSHKKYYYALKLYPKHNIITVDDDMIYHPDIIKSLYETSLCNPGKIIANRASLRTYDNGKLKPYRQWQSLITPKNNLNIVQIGCDGVLYPPLSLYKDVLDEKLFLELAPYADDLWLNAMVNIKGNQVIKTDFKYWTLGIASDAPTLTNTNVINGKNDEQIHKIREYYMSAINRDPFEER